ncbi:MAG: cobalt transporter CbiM [Syntrophobacteraceae bacterium]
MHIPDGYLGPSTFASLWAAMIGVWSFASRRLKRDLRTSRVPFLAMASAFSFVAMIFAIPLPGGTTAHITAAPLIAMLLGPWAAVISVSVALIIQALVFGDGGVTAIAANCFNIAFVGSCLGYAVYRLVIRAGERINGMTGPGAAGRTNALLRIQVVAAALGAYIGINAAALCTALELGIQPIIHGGAQASTGYFPYSFAVAVPAIMIPHLTLIGVIESAVAALVVAFIRKAQPEALRGTKTCIAVSVAALLSALCTVPILHAHTVNYEVQPKGIAVRIFYDPEDPASYSEYEILAPGEEIPHQTGRTDRNGFAAFVPDRRGNWKLKVLGESAHGFHGVTVEINVDQELNLESFKKPLASTYTKLVTGISLIIGIFGTVALISSRRKQSCENREEKP